MAKRSRAQADKTIVAAAQVRRRTRLPPAINFVRAASLFDFAAADPYLEQALAEPFVAVDAFGRILALSAEIAARLGFPKEDLVGRRLVHRICSEERNAFHRAMARARMSHAQFRIDVRMRAKDQRSERVTLALVGISRARPGAPVLVLKVTPLDETRSVDA